MKLLDLSPQFVKRIDDTHFRTDVVAIADADGLLFLCPKCMVEKPDGVGVHSIMCWAPHVPQSTQPTPGRWNLVGTGHGDLSLVAGSSSVALTGGCGAHFFVRDGRIEGC